MTRPAWGLVVTQSSEVPAPDETRARWRRHPGLALVVRAVAVLAPLTASVVVGIVASRQFRPHSWLATIVWAVWTASASLLALWVADVLSRRLLPLHRLLQLCLAFPDRAPSRVRVAVRAARTRRPEALVGREDVPPSAAVAAERIVTLLASLAMHDRRTRGHCERVTAFTDLLADQLDLEPDHKDRLTWVALVHDIGKLHVPARLLNKPGRPTVSEWRLLKTHPERGAAITEPLRDWLGEAADAVLQHHERYDGAGYPLGLVGDQISLAARLIAVTDAFEVMTAPRAYRRPVDAQTARAELARNAGTQFDPEMVRAFLAVGLPKLRRAMGPVAWLAELPFVSSWPRLEAATSTTAAHAVAATAAASTAGLLALGGSGGVIAAQAAGPDEGTGGDGSATTAISVPVELQPVSVAQISPQPAARQAVAPRRRTSPAAGHDSSATASAHAHARRAGTTSLSPSSGAHTAGQQSSSVAATDGHACDQACGHDHAPGWQKNWGPGGRQVERHADKQHGKAGA